MNEPDPRIERTDAEILAEAQKGHPHTDLTILRRDENHVKVGCGSCFGPAETYVRRYKD